jgi:hypothetical protein
MVSDGLYGGQNWESIQLGQHFIIQHINSSSGSYRYEKPGFYMTTYLIDAVCVAHIFPSFNWVWDSSKAPIHEYFSQLWEVNYKNHLYDICDYFMAPLHKIIFGVHPHRISPGAIKDLKGIGDWYMTKYYTYVRIYGATGPPHLLPKYVPDKLLAHEVAYQTIDKGVTTYLSEKNKRYWSDFPYSHGTILSPKQKTGRKGSNILARNMSMH